MEIEEISNRILRNYDFSKIKKLNNGESIIDFGKFRVEMTAGSRWNQIRVTILTKIPLSIEWTLYLTLETSKSDKNIMEQIYEAIDYIQKALLAKEL